MSNAEKKPFKTTIPNGYSSVLRVGFALDGDGYATFCLLSSNSESEIEQQAKNVLFSVKKLRRDSKSQSPISGINAILATKDEITNGLFMVGHDKSLDDIQSASAFIREAIGMLHERSAV